MEKIKPLLEAYEKEKAIYDEWYEKEQKTRAKLAKENELKYLKDRIKKLEKIK